MMRERIDGFPGADKRQRVCRFLSAILACIATDYLTGPNTTVNQGCGRNQRPAPR